MNIAIVGAQGMLGSELSAVLSASHEIVELDIAEIDIRKRVPVIAALAELRPQVIINAAAMVDVESCESQPESAWRVNALGSQNLALAAEKTGAVYLYISSDYVFDGTSQSDYDELATPCPINQYGRSKLAGEILARQICRRTYVVRTAWLYGHKPGNYVERVLTMADRDGVVRMATDQLESPTYTLHLAQAAEYLLRTGAYGTYHVTSQGACTRLEFARFILQAAGRREKAVEAPQSQRRAARPRRTVLDCRLFRLVTGHSPAHWHEGIRAYLKNASG